MSENFHSPWHPTRKAGQTAEGELLYQIEQQSSTRPPPSPPTAGVELGAFGKKFLGFGLIMLGFWTKPDANASGETWIIPVALMMIGGLGFLKGVRESWGMGWRPFANRRGAGILLRTLWAVRPRLWLIAWALIIATLTFYGSPHLRIQYGPDGCDYFGLNGWETFGTGDSCPLIKAFPLN